MPVPRSRKNAEVAAPAESMPIRYAEADLDLSVGALVSVAGVRCVILRAVDLERLLIRDNRALVRVVRIADIRPIEGAQPPIRPELSCVREVDWQRALERYRALEPLITTPTRQTAKVRDVAQSFGVHAATVYRWIARARANGVGGLFARPRTGGRGRSRVDPATDEIITTVLRARITGRRLPSIPRLIDEIVDTCRAKDVSVPHANTIRRRISSFSPFCWEDKAVDRRE